MKTHTSSSRLQHAFTLLEVILVMSVMLMVIGIGVGSFAYFETEDPLDEPVRELTRMSSTAMQTAMMQNRSVMIGFDKESFGIIGGQGGSYQHGKKIKIFLKRWGSSGWEKAEGQIWPFGEQGICEPLVVRFENAEGSRDVKFHALTGGQVQ